MLTVCKVAIRSPLAPVVDCIETFLRSRGLPSGIAEAPWPAAIEQRESGSHFPRTLSVRQVTPDVCEIHFDSFHRLESLASLLSRRIVAPVVVNIFRSTGNASYWALHAQSRVARAIEAQDGIVTAYTGEPLPFEAGEPGRPDDSDASLRLFDAQEQSRYNHEAGVPVALDQALGSPWRNYLLGTAASTEPPSARRPWWRFW